MKKILFLTCTIFAGILFTNGTTVESSIKNMKCTKESVYMALKELDIQHPDIVYAQIIIESANLNSKLYKTNNNIIGMKHPKRRLTTSEGSKNGYAYYKDWYSCLEDYAIYQQYVLKDKIVSRSQYLYFLKKNYAKDPKYKQKLIATIQKEHQIIKKADSLYTNSL